MKHSSNNRRGRSRGAGKRPNSSRHVFESNGPDTKVRGTPQQILDKYLTLARDAQTSGDRVLAESYLQFAEHYFRVMNADGNAAVQQNQSRFSSDRESQPEGEADTQDAADDGAGDDASAAPGNEDAAVDAGGETEPAAKEGGRSRPKPKGRPRGRRGDSSATASA